MKTEINLQDTFLNRARQEKVPLTVFLTNGFQLRGVVRGFDTFIILFGQLRKISMKSRLIMQ